MLILFSLIKRDLTMYAIQKFILDNFLPFTKPSFGAIKPALTRLEKSGFLTSRKSMSDGGRLSVFYTITNSGKSELKRLLLSELSENAVQFFSNARLKLACASVLNETEKEKLFFEIKSATFAHKSVAETLLNDDYNQFNFYQKIVIDNTICELKNFINIIEGFEKDNASNS